MGNFEKLSVLVIVVIIVMILVVALYTWTDGSGDSARDAGTAAMNDAPAVTPPAPNLSRDVPSGTVRIPPASARPPLAGTPGSTTASGAMPAGSPLAPAASGPFPSISPMGTGLEPLAGAEKPVERVVENKTYEVASGDNATRIVRKEMAGVSVVKGLAAIEKANPGIDLNVLKVGQKLTIPGKVEEAVSRGEAKSVAWARDAAQGATAARLEPGTLYVTHRGDTLPAISKRTYGTADRWHEIWLANYASIEDPSLVATGTSLRLPK